jgi:hypothetical protein
MLSFLVGYVTSPIVVGHVSRRMSSAPSIPAAIHVRRVSGITQRTVFSNAFQDSIGAASMYART